MLRSLLIVTSAFIITALSSCCAVLLSFLPQSGKITRRIAHLWAKTLIFIARTKIEVRGRENIIGDKPQIFMANHQSDFDILIFLAAIPVDFLWIAKKELFQIPVFGRAMKNAGYIAVDRKDHRKAMKSVDEAAERLRSGISIASFPEGTRSKEGKLLPFKLGMFYLAIQTGFPIVPVTLIGSGMIMENKSFRVKRGKIIMVIDKPVVVTSYAADARGALMENVRNIIAANYERYHREIN